MHVPQDLQHPFLAEILVHDPQVVLHGAGEDIGALGHQGDALAQVLLGDGPQVLPLQGDAAGAAVVEVHHQVHQGALAAAGLAHQGHGTAPGYPDVDPVHRVAFPIVGEDHVFQHDAVPVLSPGKGAVHRRPGGYQVQESEDVVGRRHAVQGGMAGIDEILHRPEEGEGQHQGIEGGGKQDDPGGAPVDQDEGGPQDAAVDEGLGQNGGVEGDPHGLDDHVIVVEGAGLQVFRPFRVPVHELQGGHALQALQEVFVQLIEGIPVILPQHGHELLEHGVGRHHGDGQHQQHPGGVGRIGIDPGEQDEGGDEAVDQIRQVFAEILLQGLDAVDGGGDGPGGAHLHQVVHLQIQHLLIDVVAETDADIRGAFEFHFSQDQAARQSDDGGNESHGDLGADIGVSFPHEAADEPAHGGDHHHEGQQDHQLRDDDGDDPAPGVLSQTQELFIDQKQFDSPSSRNWVSSLS